MFVSGGILSSFPNHKIVGDKNLWLGHGVSGNIFGQESTQFMEAVFTFLLEVKNR